MIMLSIYNSSIKQECPKIEYIPIEFKRSTIETDEKSRADLLNIFVKYFRSSVGFLSKSFSLKESRAKPVEATFRET